MPAVNRVTRRDLLTLLVILFAAALVRLSEPGIVEFKHDEAWITRLARDFAAGGPLPLTGMPSSVGIPNPPTSVYILAVPFVLTSDPVIATMFVAALNVIGVGLLWLLAFRYLGPTVALVAGLAYAISPWAALYSRKLWAQDLLPPFLLAAILLGLLGFLDGKRWAQVVCLPVFLFALQIHFAAWALLPLFVWLLWIGRRRLWWPGLAASLTLAALVLLPYALGLMRTLEGDPNRLANAVESGEAVGISAGGATTLVRFATGLGLEREIAPETSDALLASVPPQPQLWSLLGVLALVGLVAVWAGRYRSLAPLIALWIGVPLALFSITWTEIFSHYFIALLPALCLCIGVAVDWLLRRLPRQPLVRVVVLTAFAAILLSQFMWWRGLLRYVATNEAEGFGTPLAHIMPVRNTLLSFESVVVLAADARIDYSQEPAVWTALLDGGCCVMATDGPALMPLPQGRFAVLVTPGADADTAQAMYGEGEVVVSPDYTNDYRPLTYDAPPASILDNLTAIDPARFANGVELLSYGDSNQGVLLHWRLPEARATQYQLFVHLLDTSGERLAQHDGPFLDSRAWCAGAELLTRTAIGLPSDAATLRVGFYTLQGDRFINADLLDDAGNSAAPWLDIALQ